MQAKWIRRRLPVFILTFFLILFVDFQLRANNRPKLSALRAPLPAAALHLRDNRQSPTRAGGAPEPLPDSSIQSSRDTRGSNGHPVTRQRLRLRREDIYIAVKTTGKFHKTRLALLLQTWISRTKEHVSLWPTHTHTHLETPTETPWNQLRLWKEFLMVTWCQNDGKLVFNFPDYSTELTCSIELYTSTHSLQRCLNENVLILQICIYIYIYFIIMLLHISNNITFRFN